MKTSGKKRKRPSMRGKDYLYEICAYFFSDLLYFIMTILTLTPPVRFLASLRSGARSSGIITPQDYIKNRKRSQMNDRGQGCWSMGSTRRARK